MGFEEIFDEETREGLEETWNRLNDDFVYENSFNYKEVRENL